MNKILVMISIILLLSGCSMDREKSTNVEFNDDAVYIVDLLRQCITLFGFSEDVRVVVDDFSEMAYDEDKEGIKKRILSVYMAFLGKTNFKDKDDPNNNTLHDQLLKELDEIELILSKK
ncbi:lipoprotein [Paenibacillus sp. EC2-1]|uniref:lipoprotein n=1 Tax=Paenibacillus sp. EC2-1 TaxID=3388665 RepID=UPI003BEF3F07